MSDTSKREELIAEARQAVLTMDYERAYQGGLVGRLADALEAEHNPTDKSLDITLNNLLIEDVKPMYTPTDDEREALARVIDPGEWEDVRPRPGSFPDAPEAQATYERFFWEGVENRRKTSLLIADRLIAAGIGFRRTAVQEPSGFPAYFAPKPPMTTNRFASEPQGEPKHDASCGERCNHCQVCGTGIMYGSRCPEHYLNQPQGEPTDAQVLAALNAYYADYMIGPNKSLSEVRPPRTVHDMRAALTAAYETKGENR